MTSKFTSCATLLILLAGDGLAGNTSTASADPAAVGGVPAIDVPAPWLWNTEDEVRLGGQAVRIELDDADRQAAMSIWYRLAYINGGTRLRVFEHYPATITQDLQSDIVQSANTAWRLANEAVGSDSGSIATDRLPKWARVHTSNDTGPSGGLMLTLAYIDLLTPGKLVGNLRIAGTGGVGPDGVVTPAIGVDAKVAAAMLTRPDVVFTTSPPDSIDNITVVESHHTRIPDSGYTVSQWLNVSGYEQAGHNAASDPRTIAIVVVHDLRQALAWLCGRTDNTSTCAAAQKMATIPIGTA
jgi:hypothetical protein